MLDPVPSTVAAPVPAEIVADNARGTEHRATVADGQRATAGSADKEIAAIGPGRAGAVHRRGAGRAGTIAEKAVAIAYRAAIADGQRGRCRNWPT